MKLKRIIIGNKCGLVKRSISAVLVICVALCGWAEDKKGMVNGVVSIGSDRQLFVDDTLVDASMSRGMTRTMNPPQDIRCVLKPDQPWETLGFIFYSSVIDTGDVMQLFYGSYSYDTKQKKMIRHFCLATSKDGMSFERPDLGVKSFEGNKNNNKISTGAFDGAVFIDPVAPPEKRYRLLASAGMDKPATGGLCTEFSPDGIHWKRAPGRVLPFLPDSQHAAFYDPRLKKYVAYLRSWATKPIKSRQVCRIEVDDIEKPWPYKASDSPLHIWGKEKTPTLSTELPAVMTRDDDDPENLDIYTSTAQIYPFAPNVYLAFPATYFKFKGADWKDTALSGNDGNFEPQLALSRDGISWKRWRQPYVAPGFHDGLNLRLVSMTHGMVRRGRWIYQYFVGWTHTHGRPDVWNKNPENAVEWTKKEKGGIYCAKQRLDGFISMDSAYTGGVLTTKLLSFKGNRLQLNIDTHGSGMVKVAVLDEAGKEIPGFTAKECRSINADEVDLEVSWKNGADISSLAGRTVRVKILMNNTKLYALQFVQK